MSESTFFVCLFDRRILYRKKSKSIPIVCYLKTMLLYAQICKAMRMGIDEMFLYFFSVKFLKN